MSASESPKAHRKPAALDEFSIRADDPIAAEHAELSKMLAESRSQFPRPMPSKDWGSIAAFPQLGKLDLDHQARFVEALSVRLMLVLSRDEAMQEELGDDEWRAHPSWEGVFFSSHIFEKSLLAVLGRDDLPLTESQLNALIKCCSTEPPYDPVPPIELVLEALERFAAHTPLSATTRRIALDLLHKVDMHENTEDEARRLILLRQSPDELPLEAGEAWADEALRDFAKMPKAKQAAWSALVNHCAVSRGDKPSAKWLKIGEDLLQNVGHGDFKAHLLAWLPFVDQPRTAVFRTFSGFKAGSYRMTLTHVDTLRGLAWICGLMKDDEIAAALAILAGYAYRKPPTFGYERCPAVGRACILALGMMPGKRGVSHLTALKTNLKSGMGRRSIEKTLQDVAKGKAKR
jgi:hypothetical protein